MLRESEAKLVLLSAISQLISALYSPYPPGPVQYRCCPRSDWYWLIPHQIAMPSLDMQDVVQLGRVSASLFSSLQNPDWSFYQIDRVSWSRRGGGIVMDLDMSPFAVSPWFRLRKHKDRVLFGVRKYLVLYTHYTMWKRRLSRNFCRVMGIGNVPVYYQYWHENNDFGKSTSIGVRH